MSGIGCSPKHAALRRTALTYIPELVPFTSDAGFLFTPQQRQPG
jgi:hypothetical protein